MLDGSLTPASIAAAFLRPAPSDARQRLGGRCRARRLSFLQPLALTQSEPPFLVAQLVVLAIFVMPGIGAVKRLRPDMNAPK